MTSETYTNTKGRMIVTVWMASYGEWNYRASRGSKLHTGKVSAYDRIDAWNKAYDEAQEKELNR